MRIWDLDPGYLDRQRLLGEHRELHGLYNILTQGKKGYSRHPETLRWVGHVNALVLRHELLAEEMAFRGYNHQSPLLSPTSRFPLSWPEIFINTPSEQFDILRAKQVVESGRIPLPLNCQALWAQHKYSVMARDPELYKSIGPKTAGKNISFSELADLLIQTLRTLPTSGRITNALHHMYGYIRNRKEAVLLSETLNNEILFEYIRTGAREQSVEYLMSSTALGELGVWIRIET